MRSWWKADRAGIRPTPPWALATAGGALVVWLALAAAALAQQPTPANPPPSAEPSPPPPRGPAEIIQRAQQARQRREAPLERGPSQLPPAGTATPAASAAPLPSGHPPIAAEPGAAAPAAALPSGHPPVAAEPGAAPTYEPAAEGGEGQPGAEDRAAVGGDPHAGAPGAPPLPRRPLASAEPSPELPAGTIRVRVLDSNEQPVPGADLQLGTMSRDSKRETKSAKTGGDGRYNFDKLASGDGQAYRVNVLYDGAKYSSTPFRLPPEHGFDVTIRRLPTTRERKELVLYVGATSIELRDERLKIVQQARLINIGSKTVVFPEEGQLVKLPAGAIAFQTEEVMTDQQLREEKGEGFRILGSVVPGEVTLTWGFDVPHSSEDVELSFDLPWVTFAYRVLADAAPGMTLEVDGMPTPELHSDDGRSMYVTEIVKRVGETPLKTLKIHVRGIPGPGPTRIIAVVLAVLILAGGYALARQSAPSAAQAAPASADFDRRKAELLARARELDGERQRGEIGPEYHAEQLSEIEEALAALLYEQSRAGARGETAPA